MLSIKARTTIASLAAASAIAFATGPITSAHHEGQTLIHPNQSADVRPNVANETSVQIAAARVPKFTAGSALKKAIR